MPPAASSAARVDGLSGVLDETPSDHYIDWNHLRPAENTLLAAPMLAVMDEQANSARDFLPGRA